MTPKHYDFFLTLVQNCFNGFEYNDGNKSIKVKPFCLAAYDIVGTIDPETAFGKYMSQIPSDFIASAKSELYRSNRGWIDRGVREGKIVTYRVNEKLIIAPRLSTTPSVGIDSSIDTFIICFYDNHIGGIRYLDTHLGIPMGSANGGKEYKWHKLNPRNRQKVFDHLEDIMNISCRGILVINTNLIGQSNRLTANQMVGIIDGCFSGYDDDPQQNQEMRQVLRERFFSYCDGIPTHCDPDFQKLDPGDIVRIIVRQLSYQYGRTRDCTPAYATLQSHESYPIQLADVLVGCISRRLVDGDSLPDSFNRLFFDTRKLSGVDKYGKYVKGFYWFRGD